MGKAERAAHPIRGPGPRLCEPSKAGDQKNPLPHHPHRSPGRRNRRPHPTVRLESLCHQRGAKTAVFTGGGVVLSQRIPYRTPIQPPQESRAYRTVVCQAQRPNRGPHVPADSRRPRVDGPGVCPAAVSSERSSHTPRLAPGKQDKDDRQANGGAGPESVCRRFADHHTAHIPHPSDGDPPIFPGAFFPRTAHPNSVMLSSHERRYTKRLCLRSVVWGSFYRPSKCTRSNICPL
jgi:hypothetical protein